MGGGDCDSGVDPWEAGGNSKHRTIPPAFKWGSTNFVKRTKMSHACGRMHSILVHYFNGMLQNTGFNPDC